MSKSLLFKSWHQHKPLHLRSSKTLHGCDLPQSFLLSPIWSFSALSCMVLSHTLVDLWIRNFQGLISINWHFNSRSRCVLQSWMNMWHFWINIWGNASFPFIPEMFVGKLRGGYRRLLGVDVSTAAEEEWVLTAERQDEGSNSGHMPRIDGEQAMVVQLVRRERIDNSIKIRYCLW